MKELFFFFFLYAAFYIECGCVLDDVFSPGLCLSLSLSSLDFSPSVSPVFCAFASWRFGLEAGDVSGGGLLSHQGGRTTGFSSES